jgi:hypothetical protein
MLLPFCWILANFMRARLTIWNKKFQKWKMSTDFIIASCIIILGFGFKITKNCYLTLCQLVQNTLFLVILKPNSRIFPKTLLGGLLTFCPVNLSRESLLCLENSGRRYILKQKFCHFCKNVSDWTSHPSLSILF